MSEYNKELCDERHKRADEKFEQISEKFDTLWTKLDDFREKYTNRLNWFYIVAIGALLSMVGNIALTVIKQ